MISQYCQTTEALGLEPLSIAWKICLPDSQNYGGKDTDDTTQ